MERRGFLFLCSSIATGLWLGGDLTRLSQRIVLALGGTCSFCGNVISTELPMAGALGVSSRICGECVSFALAVLGDAQPLDHQTLWRSTPDRHEIKKHIELANELAAADRLWGPALEQAMARLRGRIEESERSVESACAFCAIADAPKLLEGRRAFVCDGCVADAAAVLKLFA